MRDVITARAGPDPHVFVSRWVGLVRPRRYLVATNRSLWLVTAWRLERAPADKVRRGSGGVRIGPMSGRWTPLELAGEGMWASRRVHELLARVHGRGRRGGRTDEAVVGHAGAGGPANVLLILGAPAFAVGTIDLLTAPSHEAQIAGIPAAATGALMLIALAGLIEDAWRRTWARPAVSSAGAAGLLLSVYLFLLQLDYRSGWRAGLLGVWATTALASLYVIRRAPPRARVSGRSDRWLSRWARRFSSAGITAGFLLALL